MAKRELQSTKMPEAPCLSCGKLLDAVSCITGDAKPVPGDLTLCAYCGGLHMFVDGVHFRLLSEDEETNLTDAVRQQVRFGRRVVAAAQFEVLRDRRGIN